VSHRFRPAIKSEAKPLIGLYSESGAGKTKSALLLARGFAGPEGRVGMIETEGGRGEAFKDEIPGSYLVLPLREDFSPSEYGKAIDDAEEAELRVLIIDSASHEWEGVGGVLHMAAQNQAAHKKGPMVWQQPKMDHARQFMGRLISTPIPLVIVCMRAKYPMKELRKTVRTGTGGIQETGEKEWIRSEVLEPKQSDDILFEMFVHGWLDHEHKFHGTKYTLDELRQVILDGEVITLDTGKRLAEWARGGAVALSPVLQGHTDASARAESERGRSSAENNAAQATAPPRVPPDARATLIEQANALKSTLSTKDFLDLCATCFDGQRTGAAMATAPMAQVEAFVDELRKKGAAA